MATRRTETWLAAIILVIVLIPLALLGMWAYMSATATTLHPNVQEVPSTARSAPRPVWASAADEGRRIVRAALTEQNLPGMSVAVGIGGDIVWAEGFGWANLENRVPVTPTTRFRIGTASNVLTSAAVGLLLEQGRLTLDDEIRTHVPEFPMNEWPVTLRQLMGQLAGVPNDGGDEGPLFTKRCERPADAFQYLSGYERKLRFEPRTEYRASNYGWIAVSAAVEAAAGERFLPFMQQHVFLPLGMNDTEADSATDPLPNRATPYFPRFAAEPRYGLHLMRPLDFSCYAGAGAFLSTPSDLVRFGLAFNSGKLLRSATVQELQTSQRLRSGAETGYGLGWDIDTVTLANAETRSIGHDGNVLGGRAISFETFPDRGLVVAVTSNISYAETSAVAVKIAQAFAAAAPPPFSARPTSGRQP